MSFSGLMSPFEESAGKLPFNILDFEEVNRRFVEWKLSDGSVLPEILQIWVYVFSHRYLDTKQPYVSGMTTHDISILAADVLLSVNRTVHTITHPEFFSNYSFRVCCNALVSYIRKYRLTDRAEEDELWDNHVASELPQDIYPLDYETMRQYLERALQKLPVALEPIIRKRFLDGVPYDVLQEETGLSYGVLRNYVHRAMTILRRDPLLAAFMEEWVSD